MNRVNPLGSLGYGVGTDGVIEGVTDGVIVGVNDGVRVIEGVMDGVILGVRVSDGVILGVIDGVTLGTIGAPRIEKFGMPPRSMMMALVMTLFIRQL